MQGISTAFDRIIGLIEHYEHSGHMAGSAWDGNLLLRWEQWLLIGPPDLSAQTMNP
jgi:hypothetical protein